MTETTSSDRARAAAGMSTPTQSGEVSLRDKKITERAAMVRGMTSQFQLAMPRGLEAHQLVRDAITAIRSVPELVNTTQESFLGALMTAAQLGLRPNVPALGHGWVLPFRNNKRGVTEAQWILGYQGMIELAQRTGMIASMVAHTIYKNEKYEIEWGINEKLVHIPIFDYQERGEPILHYAIARFTHTERPAWHVIGEDEVEAIRQGSKSARSAHSPWNTHREEMARKSAVIRLFKFLPKTTLLAQAIAADESVRVDLEPEALDVNGGDGSSTVTVPTDTPQPPAAQGDVQDAEVVADGEGPQDDPDPRPEPAGDPEPEQPTLDQHTAPPSLLDRDPLSTSALRRGLIEAIQEKHSVHLDALVLGVAGCLIPEGDTTVDDILARLTNDELKHALTWSPADA